MGKPITDAELDEIRRHHAAGMSLGATARAVGRAVSTVRDATKRAGLEWDRSKTAAAVAAHTADYAARRAAIQQRYLDIAEELQRRALSAAQHAQPAGADGEVRRWTTERPEPREVADLLRAATAATNAELRLADYHSRDGGEDAKRIVLEFGLAVRAAQLPGDDPADET